MYLTRSREVAEEEVEKTRRKSKPEGAERAEKRAAEGDFGWGSWCE